MTPNPKHSAFTLIEVLFALMVLTLGLVFVASQFPLGLAMSKEVADETIAQIEAHNSEVMIQLELERVINDPGLDINKAMDYNNDITKVHPFIQPNVRWGDIDRGDVIVVLDDPEALGTYLNKTFGPITNFPFWSESPTVYEDSDYDNSDIDVFYTNAAEGFWVGDIGRITVPQVDAGDPEVLQILIDEDVAYGDVDYHDTAQQAIYDVALTKRRSRCVFYHSINRYAYMFTLERAADDARYAIQEPATAYVDPRDTLDINVVADPYAPANWPHVPVPVDIADEDRYFPVPWRVYLRLDAANNYFPHGGTVFHYEMNGDKPTGRLGGSDPPVVFPVDEYIAAILRPGSIILDADPYEPYDEANYYTGADSPQTTMQSGEYYQVEEVYLSDDGSQWYVRLTEPLRDDLWSFWVFPPPIIEYNDNGPSLYGDKQPVISVTKVRLDF